MKLEVISKYPKGKKHSVPILFIHGAFAGAWCWEEYFLPYFADHGYESHALSLRGHGKSEGHASVWMNSVPDYVEDVCQVVRELGTSPILIGHSMGGWIVQKLMESFERPAGVLLAPIPADGLLSVAMRMLWLYPSFCQKMYLINMLPRSAWEYVASFQEMRDLFFSKAVSPETVKKYVPLFQHESYKAMWDMSGSKYSPQPRKVKTPLLVLGAENDVIISPDSVKSTARSYNTEARIFPNMGHAMMLDKDWQAVADQILDWLDKKVESGKSELKEESK